MLRYSPSCFFWSGETADVGYFNNYPLFESPHHRKVHQAMADFSRGLMAEVKLAVVFGTGDLEVRYGPVNGLQLVLLLTMIVQRE